MTRFHVWAKSAGGACLLALAACQTPTTSDARPFDEPADSAPGESIVVAGKHIPIGAPVVLWSDLRGFDGYRNGLAERGFGESRGNTVSELGQVIDQFVLHYDASSLSRVCFRTLKQRGLSVHFLLDLDGTLYQTLDLAETAWHATVANGRSVGVEIANIGAYAPGNDTLDEWYPTDAAGPWVRLPEGYGESGVMTAGYVGRPARQQRIEGTINGNALEQHDLTAEQYDTLTKLAAALCRTFPQIRADAPRDASGGVRMEALSEIEFSAFHGILGHQHVQANKVDPGPAFDWERFLLDVRSEIERGGARP